MYLPLPTLTFALRAALAWFLVINLIVWAVGWYGPRLHVSEVRDLAEAALSVLSLWLAVKGRVG